jgi:hypothetical protein
MAAREGKKEEVMTKAGDPRNWAQALKISVVLDPAEVAAPRRRAARNGPRIEKIGSKIETGLIGQNSPKTGQ